MASASAHRAGVAIPALMRRYGAARNLIVKVDIEGAEHALFRSGTDWLDHTDLLSGETHDWLFPGKGTSQTPFSALAGRKFEVIHKGECTSYFYCCERRQHDATSQWVRSMR